MCLRFNIENKLDVNQHTKEIVFNTNFGFTIQSQFIKLPNERI